MADQPTDTKRLIIKVILDSSSTDGKMTGLEGTVVHVSTPNTRFSGFGPEDIGTPISGGAEFWLLVEDTEYDPATNRTAVANWGLMFIPRGDANQVPGSPLSGKSFFSGSGATVIEFLKVFALDLNNAKIQKRSARFSWDWSLAVQMTLTDGSTNCFVSDPQMDVDQLELTEEQMEELEALFDKRPRSRRSSGKRQAPRVSQKTKKKGGKRR